MRSCVHRGSSLNNRSARQCGVTFIELLMTLAILSVLAAVAVPYAETMVIRGKELELRKSLRQVRTAIDRFHEDVRTGRVSKLADGVGSAPACRPGRRSFRRSWPRQ